MEVVEMVVRILLWRGRLGLADVAELCHALPEWSLHWGEPYVP